MKLLLDIHVFLWFFGGDERLTHQARSAIAAADNENIVSIVSVWEIAIKTSLGKLKLKHDSFEDVIEKALLDLKVTLLPITLPHLIEVTKLSFHHRDPIDRLLAAQARVERLTFVTGDEAFDSYRIRCWG